MPNMTDRTRVAAIMDWLFHGGAAPTVTQPYSVRLMTAVGSNTANGTEATAVNCPGYTAGGAALPNPSFGANAAGVSASAGPVSWTATGGWATINGVEVWDAAATPLRWLQGAITPVTLASGNTLNFATGAITADGSAW